MAYFAKVKDGKVTQVIRCKQSFLDSFKDTSPGRWIQTSYNTKGGVHYEPNTNNPSVDQSKALRKNFAGVGYTYDVHRDSFIPPQPFPSWTLNETNCLWEAPVARPSDGEMYSWNESTQQWTEVNNGS